MVAGSINSMITVVYLVSWVLETVRVERAWHIAYLLEEGNCI